MSRKERPDDEFLPRQHPRMQTFGFVEICRDDGTPLMEATIRDISRKGAQLRLSYTANLPKRFIIRSVQDHSQKRAMLKWRLGTGIGVEFDDES